MTATFTSHFYTSPDGLKLHYRHYAGPADARLTVLCIPGLTRNARDFDELAPHLAAKYRVLCVELRGRGLSAYASNPATYIPPVYVRDVATLIAAAELGPLAIIGTSLGGIVGMVLTAVMPQKVLGLVINDIGPEIDPRGLKRIAGYLGKGMPVTTWNDAAAAMRNIDAAIYPDYTDADWMKMARRRFIEGPDGVPKADYDFAISQPFAGGSANVNMWPFFARLAGVPTLVIRGETSDILSAETFARMKQVVPDLKQVSVPNRGHAPYLDEPAALWSIDGFLAELPAKLNPWTVARRTTAGAMFAMRYKLGLAGA